MAAHIKQLGKMQGKDPEAFLRSVVEIPDIPEPLEYVWRMFRELSVSRRMGAAAPEPLAYADVAAWATLHGVVLQPWEIKAIYSLDAAALKVFVERAKRRAEERKRQKNQ